MPGYNVRCHDLLLAAAAMIENPSAGTLDARVKMVNDLKAEAEFLYRTRKAPLGELLDTDFR